MFTTKTFADDISISISKSSKSSLENKKSLSYHTVKDFDSLRNIVESAHDGDVIIITGNVNGSCHNLIIKNKELSIVSNDSRYRLTVDRINIDNGKLNLGIAGTTNPYMLYLTSRFSLNNSTLNLYDGACVTDTKDLHPWINANNTDSEINLYGGAIKNNYFTSLIEKGTKTTLTIDGGEIRNNANYHRNQTFLFDVKDFKLKSGCILNNSPFQSIFAQKVTISGGTSDLAIQTNDAAVSGGNFANLSCRNAYISGGTINNVSALNIEVSGKVNIGKLVTKNIIVKDKLDKDSRITVHYDKYRINNQQKVVNVSDGVDIRDVFNNFKLSNSNYFVNNKGYVDDTPSHKYEFKDIDTGIKIESDDKITVCKNDSPDKATFFIFQLNDDGDEIVYNLNLYIDGKPVKSEDVNNISIYIPYVLSKLDLNKLNSIKIYDSNRKEITNCNKTVKSVDENLYSLITINSKQ